MNRNRANNKHVRISQTFQRWLFVVVTIAFLFTTAFLWFFQTRLSQQNAIELLSLNISDVRQDIIDASDENLLERAALVAEEINNNAAPDSAFLLDMIVKYNLAEANIIDSDGIITATTYKPFLNYDMASGTQSAEFMVLLQGQTEYAQSYQPTSYDPQILRKYGGVVLEGGGFVQVGYDSGRFQRDIDSLVVGLTRNRHVGEAGSIIIADEDFKIVSDRHDNESRGLRITGLTFDPETIAENEPFTAEVYSESCYCMYVHTEGYYIIAVLPQKEAVLSRNVSVGITTAMELIVFAALFLLIYILIKKLIVDNIHRINHSLSEITDGNLDVTVDVRSNEEFSSLSDDINSTVDTLKRYIADAAARIDAELEFARAIQHSSLPSVFPPYPGRKEFELFASMRTAKEVGGDFYDFYLIDDKTLAFLIADVSGKGIPAAMFMMQSKTLLKSCAESGMSVEEVFTQANEKLCEGNDAGMFVTAWMGILDIDTGLVTFANAGHNPPLIRRSDGSCEYLKTRPGFVLAGMESIRYRKNELQLMPGDMLYLYTDGVTEATDAANQLYGEYRLFDLLNKHGELQPQPLCENIITDVDKFTGEAPQFDDITMLCLKYSGPQKGDSNERTDD
ncbi:MAG: SpoIIE family protein phosphatase [Firmicutes bacterium]|nr:SpoIIE family protein phosphatase [Bacillota bacterium]